MFSKKRTSRYDQPVPRRRFSDDERGRDGLSTPNRSGVSSRPTPPNTTSASSTFRRNQTLSGYRRTSVEDSERQKAHQLVTQRRRLGGIFALVATVVVLLVFLLWQLIAQVSVTTSTKQLTTRFDGAMYERSINEYLMRNPSQRLRLSLDETALAAYVSVQLPEVEAVQIGGFAGIARSSLAITFRTPVAGWQINGKQQYVDAHGVVFERNYYETPAVQIVDESGITPDNGGAVVGVRLLGFLGKVVAEAQGRGYTVSKAVLPAETTRQLDVSIDGTPTRVKFSVDRGAGEQVEDAARSLQYLQTHGIGAQYIDVRVAGRAAYR